MQPKDTLLAVRRAKTWRKRLLDKQARYFVSDVCDTEILLAGLCKVPYFLETKEERAMKDGEQLVQQSC